MRRLLYLLPCLLALSITPVTSEAARWTPPDDDDDAPAAAAPDMVAPSPKMRLSAPVYDFSDASLSAEMGVTPGGAQDISFARDGKPSGSGEDQDVSSAELAFEDSLNEAADAWREYDDKVETGTKEADDLTKRFGPWYYVIDKELFDKLKPARADLVQAKAEDADAPAEGGGK